MGSENRTMNPNKEKHRTVHQGISCKSSRHKGKGIIPCKGFRLGMGALFVTGLHLAFNKTIQVVCSKPKVIFRKHRRSESAHTPAVASKREKEKPDF